MGPLVEDIAHGSLVELLVIRSILEHEWILDIVSHGVLDAAVLVGVAECPAGVRIRRDYL